MACCADPSRGTLSRVLRTQEQLAVEALSWPQNRSNSSPTSSIRKRMSYAEGSIAPPSGTLPHTATVDRPIDRKMVQRVVDDGAEPLR